MATILTSAPSYHSRDAAMAAVRSSAWHAYTAVFAATCVIVGVYWDISWHMSIGRDTFWTPAHLVIQAGGLIAGFSSGYVALRTTFRGTEDEKQAAVSFWGFRAPLGAWILIWGCGAMLTSAPFDDWWHAAYGLDVEILSPPHTVLLVGILFVLGGACVTALQAQNVAEAAGDPRARTYRAMFAYALGLLLTGAALAVWSDTRPYLAHTAYFYRFAAVPFPFMLVAATQALRMRWPATTAALIYMGIFLGMAWLLAPWPATPKLGPIRQDVTHMVSLGVPLLLAAPAFVMDVLARRMSAVRPVLQALALGFAFVAVMVAVHWWFSAFLMSPAARNDIFLGDHFPYELPKTSAWYKGEFVAMHRTTTGLWLGMGRALLTAIVSAWLGLAFGRWMREVRR